jgi:transposase-like protein
MLGIRRQTVSTIFLEFQKLVQSMLDEKNQLIGGPDVIVEIDESKFGKRKYQRGHHVEGVWIVGGVERTTERRIFLVKVENRNTKTLTDIIEKHVLPGSIIITDCWKGYEKLDEKMDATHLTVNHSKSFKDNESGAHTNTIEGTWYGIKRNINPRSRTQETIDGHLFEFIWRRDNQNNLWDSFIDALANIHYDLE